MCDHVEIEQLGLGDGFEIDYRPTITREELLAVVADYEVLVVRSRTRVDRAVLDKGIHLRLVARPGTGLDNVDLDVAKSKGVAVVNSPESLVEAVAEHVLLLMLALVRKVTIADQSVRGGKWEKEKLMGAELRGKTLGVVGFGRIGRRIGELGRALGMSLLVYDVIPIPSDLLETLGARVVELDSLFRSADFITFHVPMTPETKHLVNSTKLSLMKRTAFIINASRGGVIDESALALALESGALGGAALDVFEAEPPTGEIVSAPNTILTPHIGGQTVEAQVNAIAVVGEKIRTFFPVS